MHLHLVDTNEDIVFSPTFAHQMFGDAEIIVGYQGLSIDLYYHHTTLDTFFSIKWKSKSDKVKVQDISEEGESEQPSSSEIEYVTLELQMACLCLLNYSLVQSG